ncbi:MAG: hypothetical protein JST05_01225 [Acidobacteria bacterium]|nr:hypothetical protein [Acidobacteriota bacterium]
MNFNDALGIIGLVAIAALSFFIGRMTAFIIHARAAERRERCLPRYTTAGRLPLNPELWDGKNALDRAEAASREVAG